MARSFKKVIRDAREAAGLTLREVGTICGVTGPAVAAWEAGRAQPRGHTKVRVRNWLKKVRPAEDGRGPLERRPTPRGENERAAEGFGDEDGTAKRDAVRRSFSEWLRETREKKGMTRARLAEESGLAYQTIYLIETGRVENPWKETRERLLRALGETRTSSAVERDIAEETEIHGVGTFSDFSPWDQSGIPEIECVYVYYDRTGRPIYVGETRNLQQRNKQHQRDDKWFFPDLLEKGAYVKTTSKDQRKQIEKLLIQFIGENYMFNRQLVLKE